MQEQTMLPGCGMAIDEKIKASIGTLRLWEESAIEANPDRGYHLAFSGGKDSVVLKRLADMAGVKYEAVYNVTTIDPPELVQFIKREHPDVQWSRADRPMLAHVPTRGLPTRRFRWCCADYKERSGEGWMLAGLRAAESPRRKKAWKTVTRLDGKRTGYMLSPMIAWSADDVWAFIADQGLPYCSLYDEGFKRLGCIGCPMAGPGRRAQFARWPRFERLWRQAAHRLWARRAGTINRNGEEWFGSRQFADADALFEWWLSDESASKDDGCGMGLW